MPLNMLWACGLLFVALITHRRCDVAKKNVYTWDGTAKEDRVEYVIKENGVELTPNTIISRLIELKELKTRLSVLANKGAVRYDG